MIFTLIDVVLPVFLVIAAGYVATRSGYLKSTAIDGLMVFTQSLAIPCLLFKATMELDLGAALGAGHRYLGDHCASTRIHLSFGISRRRDTPSPRTRTVSSP